MGVLCIIYPFKCIKNPPVFLTYAFSVYEAVTSQLFVQICQTNLLGYFDLFSHQRCGLHIHFSSRWRGFEWLKKHQKFLDGLFTYRRVGVSISDINKPSLIFGCSNNSNEVELFQLSFPDFFIQGFVWSVSFYIIALYPKTSSHCFSIFIERIV